MSNTPQGFGNYIYNCVLWGKSQFSASFFLDETYTE